MCVGVCACVVRSQLLFLFETRKIVRKIHFGKIRRQLNASYGCRRLTAAAALLFYQGKRSHKCGNVCSLQAIAYAVSNFVEGS